MALSFLDPRSWWGCFRLHPVKDERITHAELKKDGKNIGESHQRKFGHKANFKMVLLALFGAVMGQGVIWYTGQFYAQSFWRIR